MTATDLAQSARGARNTKVGAIALTVAAACLLLALLFSAWRPEDGEWLLNNRFKIIAVAVLPSALPLLAMSYCFFRRERRMVEVDRIIDALGNSDKYVGMFRRIHSGNYYATAVGWTWAITASGFIVLLFGDDILSVEAAAHAEMFPKPGSSLVFGMAFLGSYIWGLEYIFRRYMLNDLLPGVFFRLSIRMLVASTVALVIFNGYEGLVGSNSGDPDGVGVGAWPALAFFLGAFPQRGLSWITAKIPFLSDKANASVRHLPLEMIEGIDTYDQMRLEEIGIDNCYDLANYDFVPLILKTSYGAREVTDWILQAKLCVRCGDAVASLRQQGIRGIHDLAGLSDEDLEPLANETAATLSSLTRAWKLARTDAEIQRLQNVSGRVTRFTKIEDPAPGLGVVAANNVA